MMRQKDTVPPSRESDEKKDQELVPRSADIDVGSELNLESYFTRSLEDDQIQDRIKGLLQDIMRDELSKMSVVLREALRNWVFKEKQKYYLTTDRSPQENSEKLKKLEKENNQLKREIELKEHENKIMLSALKKLTPKPN